MHLFLFGAVGMIVTFFGHRHVTDETAVYAWLLKEIERWILVGATLFYLGGYGAFDRLAANAVKECKEKHSYIRSTLVLPYLDREYDTAMYDDTLYPPIETTPKRLAILKRNEYMANYADVVLAYITHCFGGAYTAVEYAKRKKKQIIFY